jgi:hypothetical protein
MVSLVFIVSCPPAVFSLPAGRRLCYDVGGALPAWAAFLLWWLGPHEPLPRLMGFSDDLFYHTLHFFAGEKSRKPL